MAAHVFMPTSPVKSPSSSVFILGGKTNVLGGIKGCKQQPEEDNLKDILDLSHEDQERLLKRLTHHALCKMRRLTWRGAYVMRGGSVPGGYEPYDFALDAISKAMDGSRLWNRTNYETLESFLRSIIDSDINHLVEAVDNTKGRRLVRKAGNGETFAPYEIPGVESNPHVVMVDEEWRNSFHEAAIKELKGEEFLIKLIECMEAEITEPQEIAVVLGTTVSHVNNEKKKLRRRLDKLDIRIKPTKKRVAS